MPQPTERVTIALHRAIRMLNANIMLPPERRVTIAEAARKVGIAAGTLSDYVAQLTAQRQADRRFVAERCRRRQELQRRRRKARTND